MKSELERRLKLTIVSNYYYPDVASIANLYRQLAEYLAREMDVTVLCAVPSYLGAIPEAYHGRRYFCSRENGVRMIRIGVPAFDKTRKKQRIKSLFFYLLRAVGACRLLGKQDVILAVSQPPVFGGFIGWWLKKRTGGKFIYNIQDFNPEQIECAGFSKSPLILKTLKAMDCFFCRAADSIITVSEDMRKTLYARLNGTVPENHVINNWVDTERIVGVPKAANPLLKKYGLREQDFLVVYAGNIGIMQNLETFLRAAEKLKGRPDIRVVFIGAGARLSAARAGAESPCRQFRDQPADEHDERGLEFLLFCVPGRVCGVRPCRVHERPAHAPRGAHMAQYAGSDPRRAHLPWHPRAHRARGVCAAHHAV